jgi:MFS family permease
MSDERPVPHYTRNLVVFIGDTVAFIIAASFADSNTVMPSFARMLTSSAPLIGLISTVQSGGWLLPQLISANYIAHKERKKPYILWPCLIGRPLYLLLAAVTYFYGASNPLLTLLTLYFVQGAFYLADGLGSPPWFDILGKALPGRRRGRYLGISQTLGGLLAIGAGAVVRRILDPVTGIPFPANYSTLFLISLGFFAVSFFFVTLIKEPIDVVHAERPTWREYLPMLKAVLSQDRIFRRIITARLITGFGGLATPFFILFGIDELKLGAAIVGLCLTAQVVGRIFGGLLLGLGVAKIGNRFTVLGSLSATAVVPLLGLAINLLRPALGPATLHTLFPLMFFFLGISMNTLGWSFNNFVLDIAPAKDRSTYVGLANTLTGILVLTPILGGALLQWTSFGALFVAALIIYAVALSVAWRLPAHR